MAEIREVVDGQVVEQPSQQQPKQGESLEVANDPLYTATEQVLGVETSSQKARYETKLQTILEWAKLQTEDHTPEGIKWAIRDLQMKIGSPSAGESHIDYLYSFVSLSSKKKEIDKQLEKYYGK